VAILWRFYGENKCQKSSLNVAKMWRKSCEDVSKCGKKVAKKWRKSGGQKQAVTLLTNGYALQIVESTDDRVTRLAGLSTFGQLFVLGIIF
jgi:hypothetical protein